MNGPQHLTRALDLVDEARTADASDEDATRVVAIYLDAVVEALAALTLATVHSHLPRDIAGDWRTVSR